MTNNPPHAKIQAQEGQNETTHESAPASPANQHRRKTDFPRPELQKFIDDNMGRLEHASKISTIDIEAHRAHDIPSETSYLAGILGSATLAVVLSYTRGMTKDQYLLACEALYNDCERVFIKMKGKAH